MPKKYMLEVAVGNSSDPPLVYHSTQPFGSIAKGDKMTLIGEGGKLVTRSVGLVEHTVWIEGKTPVHKVLVTTT